jgi:hypothetical protein
VIRFSRGQGARAEFELALERADLVSARRILSTIPPTLLRNGFLGGYAVRIWIFSRDGDRARAALAAIPGDFISTGSFKGPKAWLEAFAYAIVAGKREAARARAEAALRLLEINRNPPALTYALRPVCRDRGPRIRRNRGARVTFGRIFVKVQ